MTLLALSHLTKRYADHTVLDDVSLTISAGERIALLGHNGAGKSTLMKLILGLIPASEGQIEVAGHLPGSTVARSVTAYLPENAAFHPGLTGMEQIRHFLRLRGQPASDAKGLLEKVGLGKAANRKMGTYSKGMRQRVGLAQALIGAPQLMVLDEPTSGLDPVSRREFYALLDELSAKGTAVLLSSHALSELEARTDRIVILSSGKIVAEGPLSILRNTADLPTSISITPQPGKKDLVLAAFPEAQVEKGGLVLQCAAGQKLNILERITTQRHLIQDFDISAASLDDLYAHISRRAA